MEHCYRGRIAFDTKKLCISTPMNVAIFLCLFNKIASNDSNGGAIFIFGHNSANLNISECKFYKCKAGGNYTGGAIFASMRESSLTRTAFDCCTSFFCFSFYIRSKFDFNFFFNQSSIFSCRNPAEAVALAYCGHQKIDRFNCSHNSGNSYGCSMWSECPKSISMLHSILYDCQGYDVIHFVWCDESISIDRCIINTCACAMCLINAFSSRSQLSNIYISNIYAPYFAVSGEKSLTCMKFFSLNSNLKEVKVISNGWMKQIELINLTGTPFLGLFNVAKLDDSFINLPKEKLRCDETDES